MRASSGTSSQSSLPFTMASANSAAGSSPPGTGTSATFEDVMQQQGGGSSNASKLKEKTPSGTDKASDQQATSSATTSNENSPTPDPLGTTSDAPAGKLPAPSKASDGATPSADTSGKDKSAALPVASDLSTMIVQATAMASNARQTPVLTTPPDPAAKTPAESGNDSDPGATSAKNPFQFIPGGPDLSAMIVQALILASSASKTSISTAPTNPAAKTPAGSGNDSGPGATSAQDSSRLISGAPDLSTLIAQASVLASNAQQASVSGAPSDSAAKAALGLCKELPLLGSIKGTAGNSTKEKKSASASAEGSFLQSGATPSDANSNRLGLLGSLLASANDSSGGQQLTSNGGSKNPSVDGLSGSAFSLAGTANVEKEKAMSATLNFPEILSSFGTNTASQQTPVDMHIQLSTNNDFEDALKQVMHVAQLTQTNESRTPMRVAMEIQTPPGAIVNVYVSRQNDQWRAQLSTNDPQALSWVQDKMNSLRQSGDFGVEVRWLPPQMESSSGNNANLSWDRGGQGQQGYQNQDERQQSGRQKKAELYAGIGAGQFMNTLTALGRAA